MNTEIYIEITGRIDSRKLYLELEQYQMNVTDLGRKVLIYGDTSMRQAIKILDIVSKYANFQAHITPISPD